VGSAEACVLDWSEVVPCAGRTVGLVRGTRASVDSAPRANLGFFSVRGV